MAIVGSIALSLMFDCVVISIVRGDHDDCAHLAVRASFTLDEAWGAPGARTRCVADHVGRPRRVRLWHVGLHDQDSGHSQASHGAILRSHEAAAETTTIIAEKAGKNSRIK